MIGGKIGDDRNMGTASHRHQLERGQLQHRHILRLDGGSLRQQRMTDIAAQVDRLPCRTQKLCNDRSSGGFSIAASHCDDGTGAHFKKHFHLRSERASPRHCRRQFRHIRACLLYTSNPAAGAAPSPPRWTRIRTPPARRETGPVSSDRSSQRSSAPVFHSPH